MKSIYCSVIKNNMAIFTAFFCITFSNAMEQKDHYSAKEYYSSEYPYTYKLVRKQDPRDPEAPVTYYKKWLSSDTCSRDGDPNIRFHDKKISEAEYLRLQNRDRASTD